MDVLNHHKLYANLKKCEFGKTQVAYLGHIISASVVAVDMEKVKAMVEWGPCNLRQLRGFLGLIGYYRKFITNYAIIIIPLTHQLKKDNFGWR